MGNKLKAVAGIAVLGTAIICFQNCSGSGFALRDFSSVTESSLNPSSDLPTGQPTPSASQSPTPVATTSGDADDILTWVHSQLPATTYISVHAEKRICELNKTITASFQKGLGRAPGASELSYYLSQVNSGVTYKNIRVHIAASPESLNANISSTDFLVRVFRLLLLREPQAGELDRYAQVLAVRSRKDIVDLIVAIPEFASVGDCLPAEQVWGNVTAVDQPFKSMVDPGLKAAYWRKDSMENFYGEVFLYDSTSFYLKSETMPVFAGIDPAGTWQERADKTREFAPIGSSYISHPGRILGKRKISTAGTGTSELATFACYNFADYAANKCATFQYGVKDRFFYTVLTNFSNLFDGDNTDTAWKASDEFKSFDKVVVINQEMNGHTGRERFFFGYRKGLYYGIIRWDNSTWDSLANDWHVIERTVGLQLKTSSAFNFEGMKARGAFLSPRAPRN